MITLKTPNAIKYELLYWTLTTRVCNHNPQNNNKLDPYALAHLILGLDLQLAIESMWSVTFEIPILLQSLETSPISQFI